MIDLKLTQKTHDKKLTTFKIGDIIVGESFFVIAGPCSVESEEQVKTIALAIKKAGADMLRGGAYKPRTSPYSFQGLKLKGLRYLREAGDLVGLPIITEVIDTRDVYLVAEYADVLQIGARNMQNYALLQEVGRANVPVLLKRGMHATISEWLYSAEYLMNEGNERVIMCERGIRTMENYTRNTLDLSAVSSLKHLTHLPVIVDPSHATGRTELVEPMSLSGIMAGADGLMIEVHNCPENALSDGEQSLQLDEFSHLMNAVKKTIRFKKDLL